MYDCNHLVGLPYIEGKQDCFSLVRIYYREAWGIELPNFARPHHFWNDPKLDLYQMYKSFGFELMIDKPYQLGDGLLMPFFTQIATHAGVLAAPNKILHHLPNRLSTLDVFLPRWSSRVTMVVRHPEVTRQLQEQKKTVSLHEVGNAHIFRDPGFKEQLDRVLGSES